MKTSFLWGIIALLLGASVFGVYKSIELLKKNSDLSRAVDNLKLKLVTTEAFLNQTKEALRESQFDNAKLEGKNRVLNSKLSEKEKQLQRYKENLTMLSNKLKQTVEINASLAEKNRETSDRLVRLEFENDEMKNKLSSIPELKKAIKDLKIKIRQEKRSKRAVQTKQEKILAVPALTEAVDVDLKGNRGYLLKDGRPTFDAVDIRVLPAEPGN